MSAISKTAKASMIKEVKKSEVDPPEEMIRKIRLNLAAYPTLYIPSHYVKVLLNAYDDLRLEKIK